MIQATRKVMSGSLPGPWRVATLLVALSPLLWPRTLRAAEDPVVRLATLDWPPYIGQDLPEQGWIARVMREALARGGYRVELVWLPWTRALQDAALGDVDAVLPLYDGPGRRETYLLSAPLPAAGVGLWTRRGTQVPWDGADVMALSALRIGVVQGYVNHPVIDDPARGLLVDQARNDALNLSKLAEGRVDVAVVDFLVAAHLVAQDPALSQLTPVVPPFEIRPTYVGFSRQTGRGGSLLQAFDLGLAAMRQDGTLARIIAEAGLEDELVVFGPGTGQPAPLPAAAP